MYPHRAAPAITTREPRADRADQWRDRKKYLWLLGALVPGAVFASWLAVESTGLRLFWWLGPFLTFVTVPLLDYLVGTVTDDPPDSAFEWLDTDRFYRWATNLYLPTQYLSLLFACWLWSGGGWLSMSTVDKAGLMVTVGIVGGIAINAAHELGHKRASTEQRLSRLALAQTCYGHFFVEHNRGHHMRVATVEDPASSRFGESVYRFVVRSVTAGARSAWHLERRRLAKLGRSPWTLRNEVLSSWLLSASLFGGLALWFGPAVLPWLAGQAVIGFSLLEAVNYLEHYGLRRQKLASGRYERVRPAHSWNSDTLVTNVFLFHLQRHSDHHTNPRRRYQTLRPSEQAPQLPAGYGAMLALALVPPLWRRVMDPRVLAHYGGDMTLTALSPQALQARMTLGVSGLRREAEPSGGRPTDA
ncbi:MAG: alkane 1-monooxygenase [Mycobacterium sp.]|nr:alkane 1-monooxygenase [Mycobacterium sp.]